MLKVKKYCNKQSELLKGRQPARAFFQNFWRSGYRFPDLETSLPHLEVIFGRRHTQQPPNLVGKT